MSERIKFYTDAHIAKAVVRGLRERGLDVLSVQDTRMFDVPDDDHLRLAIEQDRVIVTQDADFLRFNSENVEHRGFVYAPQGTSIGEIIRGLMLIWEVLEPSDMQGHVEYL